MAYNQVSWLSLLTFVRESSEEVSLDRLESLRNHFFIDNSVWRIIVVKQVDEFNQAFLLRFLQLLIFLRVREVCCLDACAELCDVEELPLGSLGVLIGVSWMIGLPLP